MASRVKIDVSFKPIVTLSMAGGADKDVISDDIGKTLGGSCSVATGAANHVTVGWGDADGVVAYANAPANGGAKIALGADAGAYKAIIVRHTGFEFSSATVLSTTANTQNLLLYFETSAGMATSQVISIPAGGAITLPNVTMGADTSMWLESAGNASIAVEYALVS